MCGLSWLATFLTCATGLSLLSKLLLNSQCSFMWASEFIVYIGYFGVSLCYKHRIRHTSPAPEKQPELLLTNSSYSIRNMQIWRVISSFSITLHFKYFYVFIVIL